MGKISLKAAAIPLLTTALIAALCSCAAQSSGEALHLSTLNADPSLFEPPTHDRYTLQGEILGVEVQSSGVPLDQVTATAHGSIEVTDGIMSSAEITATIDSTHRVKFELTEPVIFERQGNVSELIVGVGKITTDTGVYYDSKVYLTPKEENEQTTIDATIEMPSSLRIDNQSETGPLQLALTLERH